MSFIVLVIISQGKCSPKKVSLSALTFRVDLDPGGWGAGARTRPVLDGRLRTPSCGIWGAGHGKKRMVECVRQGAQSLVGKPENEVSSFTCGRSHAKQDQARGASGTGVRGTGLAQWG